MYTVYIEQGSYFYNVDQLQYIIDQSSNGFYFQFELSMKVGAEKSTMDEIFVAIHNAKKISEQNGVPVILDLSDGTPIIKKLQLP